MADKAANVQFTPGFMILTDNGGRRTKHKIELTVDNIPSLTYEQVAAIKTLSNMFAVLYRALIVREILDEGLLEDCGYDLPAIVQTIKNMGGDFGEPDLTVT